MVFKGVRNLVISLIFDKDNILAWKTVSPSKEELESPIVVDMRKAVTLRRGSSIAREDG